MYARSCSLLTLSRTRWRASPKRGATYRAPFPDPRAATPTVAVSGAAAFEATFEAAHRPPRQTTDHSTRASPATTVADRPDAHEAQRVRSALAARNQVQRLLRRLPLGLTDHDLYFNELPSNLKEDMLKAAYYTRRAMMDESARASSEGSSNRIASSSLSVPRDESELREIVTLRGPHVTIAREKITSHRQHIEAKSASHPVQRLNAQESATRMADAVKASSETVREASLALPDMERTSASLGLSICTPLPSVVTNADGSHRGVRGGVMISTDNTAVRRQYAAAPVVYILGIPEPLLDVIDDENIADWLRRLLLFDEITQELLLRLPAQPALPRSIRHTSSRADLEGLFAHIFLVQTFSFSPHDVHRAMTDEANQPRGRDDSRCRYRPFFLTQASGVADTNPSIVHALKGTGILFPSFFTSYHLDIDAYTAPPSLRERDIVSPWTPLRMKRMHKNSTCTEPDLWSVQVSGRRMHTTSPAHTGGTASSPSAGTATSAEKLRELRRVFATHQLRLLQRVGGGAADGKVSVEALTEGEMEARTEGRQDALSGRTTHPAMADASLNGSLAAPGEATAFGDRRTRWSFAVSEYHQPRPFVASPSRELSSAAGWLPHALHDALFHQRLSPITCLDTSGTTLRPPPPHATTKKRHHKKGDDADAAAHPAFPSSTGPTPAAPLPFLPTASAALMFARERVLLPFMRRPRQRWCREHGGGQGSPWLWSMAALEALMQWRTRFSSRYGPFHNLLSAELVVGLGVFSSPSAASAPAGAALLLLHDAGFIEGVLLPAMLTYAVTHYHTDSQRGLLTPRAPDGADAQLCLWLSLKTVTPNEVLNVLDTQPDVAAAVHYRRLYGWARTVSQADRGLRDIWLHKSSAPVSVTDAHADDADVAETPSKEEEENMDGHAHLVEVTAHETAVVVAARAAATKKMHKLPVSIKPFFQRADALLAEAGPSAHAQPAEVSPRTLLDAVHVVPIRPFLVWLAHDPSVVISREDEQKACLYFASWNDYFTLSGGVTTTVALCASPSQVHAARQAAGI